MTGLYVLARFGVIDSIHRQAASVACPTLANDVPERTIDI